MKLEKETIYVVLLLVHLKEQRINRLISGRTDRQCVKVCFCLFSPLLPSPDATHFELY